MAKNTRHCEERSDEAIQGRLGDALDCFHALAMTIQREAIMPYPLVYFGAMRMMTSASASRTPADLSTA